MGYCGAIGFWAYNTIDLQAYGYISSKLVLQMYPGEVPKAYNLQNPFPGETFKFVLYVDEFGKPILDDLGRKQFVWLDTRILLPSKTLLFQFMYSTSVESSNISLGANAGSPDFGALGAGAGGGLINSILDTTTLGGVNYLTSKFCWHVCSSKTRIDMVFPVDDTVRKNKGVIQLPGYVVSCLGAFAKPLNLDEGQRANLGVSLTSVSSRFGMVGDVNGEGITQIQLIEKGGHFKNKPYTALFPSPTNSPIQNHNNFDAANLLVDVLFDSRAKAFRADNWNLTQTLPLNVNPVHLYGPQTNQLSSNDVTANYIQIDLDKFGKKDGNVYVTACLATKRYFREWNLHSATIAETPDRVGGVTSQQLPIKSLVESWHYQIAPTRVKKLPILVNSQGRKLDQAYIDTIKVGLDTFSAAQEALTDDQKKWETVNDWRVSETFTFNITQMYHADSTGILLLSAGMDGLGSGSTSTVTAKILIPAASIKDQAWFAKYLSDNNLTTTNFVNDTVRTQDFLGALFDLSEQVNTALPDIHKIPYCRAFALALRKIDKSLGVGITNLDIIGVNGSNQFDLSSAVFKEVSMSSVNPLAWDASTCGNTPGSALGGSYYDPQSPAEQFTPWFTGTGIFIDTPWLMSTPQYHANFDRNTRVYVEKFLPNGLTFVPSGIFVYSVPNPQSSLSLDYCPYNDEIFAFFEDNNVDGIAYYTFSNTVSSKFLGRLKYFATGTHDRGVYDSDTFKYISYSLAAGQLPAYSEGALISNERNFICNGMPDSNGKIPTFDTIYTKAAWKLPASISEPYTIQGSPSDALYRDIILEYTVDDDLVLATNDDNTESLYLDGEDVGDNFISLEFQANNQVIDNIPMPFKKGTHKVFIDGHLYGGNPVILHGKFLSLVNWKSANVVYTTTEKITEWQVVGKQTATAIDGNNRIHVFYADQSSGNITVAVSADLGATWSKYTDIIRLTQGENADSPYCICDKESNTVYLFYLLNSSYLMVKTIQTDWFVCEDQFQQYTPPSTFDETSDDDLNITQYTRQGQDLRRAISYFVIADISDSFVTRQTSISTTRLKVTPGEKPESSRYTLAGDIKGTEGKQMDTSFSGGTYAAYRDSRGKFRVVFDPGTGNISIRTSTDLSRWYYDVKEAVVHKNFFNDTPTTADLSATNPQIVYDDLNESVYLFYFNQGSLFVRRFDNNLLYPDSTTLNDFATYNGGGSVASSTGTTSSSSAGKGGSVNAFYISDRLKTHIEITRKSTNLPLFLVGALDSTVLDGLNLDKKNGLSEDLTKRQMAIDFAYEKPDIFTDAFSVEDACKPVGYLLQSGVTRLLYRISDGLVYGITLNAMIPTLDCQRRYKV